MRDLEYVTKVVMKAIEDELAMDEGDINATDTFDGDLGADSFDLLAIFTELEDEFNLDIPKDKFKDLNTPQALIDYIFAEITA